MKKGELIPHFGVKSNGFMKMEVKDVDTSKRIVKWVGNTYNYLDSDYDVLMPGCAKNSIALMGPGTDSVAKIKFAVGHDLTMLPGKIVELEEGKCNINGMNVDCLMGATKMADTTLGNDTLTNYLEGILDNHSIGFQYMKYEFLERGHGNSEAGKAFKAMVEGLINPDDAENINCMLRVDEIKLFEISAVAFGANKLTPYLGSKSGNPESVALLLENRLTKLYQTIKKGTQSDDMLFNIEIQYKQLLQFQRELFAEVTIKDSLKSKFGLKENQPVYTDISKGFSLE